MTTPTRHSKPRPGTHLANGPQIRALRELRCWSQETLIAQVLAITGDPISKQTLSRLENGQPAYLHTFELLARVFELENAQAARLYLDEADEEGAAPLAPGAGGDDLVTLRRKENAVRLARQWAQTEGHRLAIEKAIPGSIIWREDGFEGCLSPDRAAELYEAGGEESQAAARRLRGHLIEMLNYFEIVATAYRHQVGDRAVLEEQFRNTMIRWYQFLEPLIEVAWRRFEGHHLQPWEPYVDLVDRYWKRRPYSFVGMARISSTNR